MITIINRNPTGRLISLYSLLKFLDYKYKDKPFSLNDMKFDIGDKITILDFFPLAKVHPLTNKKYDPYLENPFSPAGSHLTQSIQYDSQKSKSVSDCANALEALGFIKPINSKFIITLEGTKFIEHEFNDPETFEILHSSVLNYGVFVGFLFECWKLSKKTKYVDRNNISIGFPTTREIVSSGGKNIILSTGSQRDTMTRTKSVLLAWAITAGYCLPEGYSIPKVDEWHVKTLGLITEKKWLWRKFQFFIDDDLFNGNLIVKNPLNYNSMTKSTKALRERGQAEVRSVSLEMEKIVKNRRFAIVYALAYCAENNKKLNFNKLLEYLSDYPDIFVVNKLDFIKTMQIEKDITIIAGIPFNATNDNILEPLTKINMNNLKQNADPDLLEILNKVIPKTYV